LSRIFKAAAVPLDQRFNRSVQSGDRFEDGEPLIVIIQRRVSSFAPTTYSIVSEVYGVKVADPYSNKASSQKSMGHRYAPMGVGSSARAAREPDVG
jgi:hypothetical protein